MNYHDTVSSEDGAYCDYDCDAGTGRWGVMNTDWQGRSVPDNETPETVIRVWEITPHPTSRQYGSLVIRSWQEMLRYMNEQLDIYLESFEVDEISEGVSLKFRVVEMTNAEYDEILHSDD